MRLFAKYRKKGVALFVVMITATVLALMMAAFFQAYRSHFALTRSSVASQRAGSACDSVYQYVVYRIEHDRTWGAGDFTDSGLGDPQGAEIDVTEEIGTNRFTGAIKSLDATFEGEIFNNLEGSGTVAEEGTVLCRVTARSGVSTRNAEFVVRIAPLFDSSVLSRADLDVGAEKLYLRSRDENRNLLRAEGDIYVPDILNGSDSQFLQPDSNDADDKGMLWSKGEIFSYLGSGGTAEAIDTADELADATNNSNGKIVAGAESDFQIYDLDVDNLQLPETNSEVRLQDDDGTDLDGRWNFVRRKAEVTYTATYESTVNGQLVTTSEQYTDDVWIDVLEYYGPDSATDTGYSENPEKVYRAESRNDDLMTAAPQTVTEQVKVQQKKKKKKKKTTTIDVDLGITGVTTDGVEMGYDVPLEITDQLSFVSDDGAADFTFDLLLQSVTASPNATVTINGDFQLTSETDPGIFDPALNPDGVQETPPPVLDLAYSSDGTQKAALVAEGTLNIENGVTTGLGALVAKDGDVSIQPMNTDTVTVDAGASGTGLLVFAGGDVVLTNPDETAEWVFNGLVYARDGIRMEGHGQNATFEGTIVSLQEEDAIDGKPNGIEFVDCGEIEFIYNSELLDAFVKSLPGQRIQLETVYWKR
jgi:hypothetical protein